MNVNEREKTTGFSHPEHFGHFKHFLPLDLGLASQPHLFWKNPTANDAKTSKNTWSLARDPLSLAMTLKSKAKPIMPPAAHQWPLKAATVGRGKQQTLRSWGFEPGTKEAKAQAPWFTRGSTFVKMLKPPTSLAWEPWELQEMDH